MYQPKARANEPVNSKTSHRWDIDNESMKPLGYFPCKSRVWLLLWICISYVLFETFTAFQSASASENFSWEKQVCLFCTSFTINKNSISEPMFRGDSRKFFQSGCDGLILKQLAWHCRSMYLPTGLTVEKGYVSLYQMFYLDLPFFFHLFSTSSSLKPLHFIM